MINSVALTGRLTKDVDLRTTQSGISVASFTLAVNRQYSKDKEADFINCVAFKKTAEVLQQFAGKGRRSELLAASRHGTTRARTARKST